MDMRKILIADGTDEFRNSLANALQGMFHVRTCADGCEAVELLSDFDPDLLVVDVILPGVDGLTVMEKSREQDPKRPILALSRISSDYICDAVMRLRVEYLMTKPNSAEAAAARLTDMLACAEERPTAADPRTVVSNMLVSLGIPVKRRGYNYLREAVLLMAKDPTQAITKELYPAVGTIFQSASGPVEKAIRTVIESAWQNRDDKVWRLYFAPDPTGNIPRPTNAAFIARLADCLQQETRAMEDAQGLAIAEALW